MTKTTRIVCLCILGAVGMLCGIPTAYASLSRCSETLINHTNITHYTCDSNDHPIVNQAVGNGETPQWPIDDKPGLLLDKGKPIAPSQDLQITENITTLQEQEGCETAILANYAYLADGTKFKATNADGDGFVYTGSLRWRLKDGVLTPESVAITGGRAVCDTTDTWAANYYICDHLGSVRTVTDENGTVLANYDYLPYGTDMLRDAATADVTDYRFTGKELQRDFGANLYDSFARFQHNNGRFLSIDPKAEAFYHISPYAYCAGNPVNLVDPDGEKPRIYIQGGGVGHVFLSVGDGRNIIIYSYGRYGTLHEFLGRTWGSANPTGEGVMYKYEGEEAYEFLHEHKAEIMAVFEVNSNDDSRIMSYYDAQLDPNKRPTNKSKKSYYDKNAYVIDAYHIIKNNCVKKTLKVINLVNSYIDGDYIMPASLHYALIQKTRENGSYITEISINDILNYGINE